MPRDVRPRHIASRMNIQLGVSILRFCRILPTLLCLPIVAICSLGTLLAQLPIHQLHSLSQVGAQRGQTVTIALNGADLLDIRQLVFSDKTLQPQLVPGTPDPVTELSQPQWGNFTLAIPADQPLGIYEVWAVGRYGVSNSRRFVVDSLAVFNDPGNNNTSVQASPLTLPTAVQGKCDTAVIDYYKLDLKEGESISIECFAKSIDSRLTPVLAVVDGKGKELATVRGHELKDPVLQFTASKSDSYYLTIKDFLLEGGPNSYYWLRVLPSPAVEELTPSIASVNSTLQWKGIGQTNKPGTPRSTIEVSSGSFAIPENPMFAWQSSRIPLLRPMQATVAWVEVPRPDEFGRCVVVAPANSKVYADITPSTQVGVPTPIELPAEISTRFAEQTQDQYFQFNADKDTKLTIDLAASKLGQVSDAILAIGRIHAADKPVQWLVTLDDPPNRESTRRGEFDLMSDDPVGEFTIPETGTYCVRVRNQYRSLLGSSPRYHLSLQLAKPDFQAFVAFKQLKRGGDQQTPIAALNLVRGLSVPLQIQVVRKAGFNEPIEVKVDGLPAGVTASSLVIPSGRSDGWLVLSATLDAAIGESNLSVVATSKLGEQTLQRSAIPMTVVWDSPDRNNTPAAFRVTSALILAVTEEPPRVAVTATSVKPLDERQRIVVAPGEEVKLTMAVHRINGFAAEVKLKQQGLPDPWGGPEVTLAPDASQVEWVVKVPAENSVGVYPFFFRGDLGIPFQPNPQSLTFLTQTKEKLTQKQTLAQQEKEAATAANNADQVAAADAKLADINNRIMQTDKQLEEANKANAVQNKDIAVWSNGFVLEVKAPSP